MDELAGFGAPGFESWALEVWFCPELLTWPFTDQASQEWKTRSELHRRGPNAVLKTLLLRGVAPDLPWCF